MLSAESVVLSLLALLANRVPAAQPGLADLVVVAPSLFPRDSAVCKHVFGMIERKAAGGNVSEESSLQM